MKLSTRSRFSQSSGFTLVELLVVIAIIAILASVLAVSAGAVIKSANRAKVNANASQIQTAALNYYTEYGVYPAPSAQTAGTDFSFKDTDTTDWSNLIDGLSGGISPSSGKAVTTSTVNNTRGIVFLTMKNSDVVGGSSPTTADAPKNLVAPSGNTSVTYNIAIDYDYDGILGIAPSAVTTMPNFATSTATSLSQTGGSSSAGVAIWVNTTGYTTGSTNALNGNLWVKTY